MRSSGSTRSSLARAPVPLFVRVVGDDHPKACTGRRLLRRGLARETHRAAGLRPPPVLLDPFAPDPLSGADRPIVLRGGILVVDCSWNQLGARGGFPEPGGTGRRPPFRRRLPILIAANHQHYGRIAELNTVEAFAAALYLVDRRAEAASLLDGFPGGDGFLSLNRTRLDRYLRAQSADEVRDAERELYGHGDAEAADSRPATPPVHSSGG